jgi:exopolyphosphatase/guanosine-5'-triphosphate,3'-diphosphate pyrophosphatase
LLPSLAIYRTLSEFASSDAVISPSVTLLDSLLFELLYPKEARDWSKRFEEGAAASAWEMARRYQADANHAAAVESYAMLIFDALKKVHGFSGRERRLLQAAAILHDIGKFVDSKYHDVYSCHLLMDSNIIGFSTAEMAKLGNIARYHSGTAPSLSHAEYAALAGEDRLSVSKLASILRLADSLDRSHLQKFSGIEIKLKDNELIISCRAERETALEEWTFGYKSGFFTEVFGLRCVFRRKGKD